MQRGKANSTIDRQKQDPLQHSIITDNNPTTHSQQFQASGIVSNAKKIAELENKMLEREELLVNAQAKKIDNYDELLINFMRLDQTNEGIEKQILKMFKDSHLTEQQQEKCQDILSRMGKWVGESQNLVIESDDQIIIESESQDNNMISPNAFSSSTTQALINFQGTGTIIHTNISSQKKSLQDEPYESLVGKYKCVSVSKNECQQKIENFFKSGQVDNECKVDQAPIILHTYKFNNTKEADITKCAWTVVEKQSNNYHAEMYFDSKELNKVKPPPAFQLLKKEGSDSEESSDLQEGNDFLVDNENYEPLLFLVDKIIQGCIKAREGDIKKVNIKLDDLKNALIKSTGSKGINLLKMVLSDYCSAMNGRSQIEYTFLDENIHSADDIPCIYAVINRFRAQDKTKPHESNQISSLPIQNGSDFKSPKITS